MRQRVSQLYEAITLLTLSIFSISQLFMPLAAYATPPIILTDNPEDQVTICHRTRSATNPYRVITVDQSAVDNITGNEGPGVADHFGKHNELLVTTEAEAQARKNLGLRWGDIIPPIPGIHLGLNWTSAGQAMYNNDCNFIPPTPRTGALKVNKLVDHDGDGVFDKGNRFANNLGFQWGLDAASPNRDFGTTQSGLAIGPHSVTENSVSNYHFVGWYHTNSTGGSCTSRQLITTLPAVITVVANQTADITLCNALDEEPEPGVGNITIIKDTNPDDPADFDFTLTHGERSTNFTLDDDGPDGSRTPNNKVFLGVPTGTYSLSEHETRNWILKDVDCGEHEFRQQDQTITFELATNEAIICTFKNVRAHGSITVIKDAKPNDPTDFSFTIRRDRGPARSFMLDDDGDNSNELSNRKTFEQLPLGHYTIRELVPDGWDLAKIRCHDKTDERDDGPAIANENHDGGRDDNSVGIDLEAGAHIVCKFINHRSGTIKATKYNDLNSNGKFDEGEPTLPGWTINLDSRKHHFEHVTDENGVVIFDDLKTPRTYKLSEDLQEGWELTDITCKSQNRENHEEPVEILAEEDWQWEDNGDSEKIRLHRGERVECLIGNHQNASLNLSKSNNKPQPTIVGDVVTYTLTVSVPTDSGTNFNTIVQDITPEGFIYQTGSWTANSSVRGDIMNSPTTEPPYASPGEWQLGDLIAGEVVILTYRALIQNSVSPGIYPDLAYAESLDSPEDGERIFSNATADPTGAPFVGTQVTVETSLTPSGQVLPSTGPSPWVPLLISVLGSMVAYYWLERKRRLDYA